MKIYEFINEENIEVKENIKLKTDFNKFKIDNIVNKLNLNFNKKNEKNEKVEKIKNENNEIKEEKNTNPNDENEENNSNNINVFDEEDNLNEDYFKDCKINSYNLLDILNYDNNEPNNYVNNQKKSYFEIDIIKEEMKKQSINLIDLKNMVKEEIKNEKKRHLKIMRNNIYFI